MRGTPARTTVMLGPTPGRAPSPTCGRRSERSLRRYEARKRALDVVVASLVLLLCAPVLLVCAALVSLSSPGPVLHRQRRVGRDGRAFVLLKLRSMRCAPTADVRATRPAPGVAPGGVEGVDRRTPVGRVLRRTSLDELPQLWNVIRGDMSLVGPRPERPEFVELFADEVPGYAERHRVRGGMTGLAQVSGLRGRTSIAARALADLHYIETASLRGDLVLLVRTAVVVLAGAE